MVDALTEGLSELGRAAVAYARAGWGVVPLRPRSKEPATRHGLRDWTDCPEDVAAAWREHPDLNVGIACGAPSGGLLVIDLDCHDGGADGWESMRGWEREHGGLPETCSAVTGSGGTHLLYVASGEVRPSANPELAVDVRGDGSYVVAPPSVHPTGRRYEWEVPPEELAPQPADARVMAFVDAVRPAGAAGDGGRLDTPEVIAEGGRNDALYRAACSMRAKGLAPDAIAGALAGINAARCRPPLSADEVGAIARSACERPAGRSAEWEAAHPRREAPAREGATAQGGGEAAGRDECPAWLAGGRFRHDLLARMMVDEMGACRVDSPDGILAVWDEAAGRWAMGPRGVSGAMIAAYPRSKMADRREVMSYLEAVAPVRPQSRPELIAFRNGVLDVSTGDFRPMEREDLIANVIPHDFDPGAECPELDALLDRLACGDWPTRQNLVEVAGLCLYRSNCYSQAPVLLGGGANGKSTYLKVLKRLLGGQNYSTLDLGEMGQHFQAGQLAGKLANVGDDISNEFARGDVLSVFKKIVSGEDVYTDVKGGQGYHFRPYCTVIFSANEMPKLGDHSDGVMRRLFPIRFNAHFDRAAADWDPHVLERVTTERAMSALASQAVVGLASVMAQGGLTQTEAAAAEVREMRVENDTVLQWLAEMPDAATALCGEATPKAFGDYSEWCRQAGCKSVGQRTFTRRVMAETGLANRRVRTAGGGFAVVFAAA